jgi:hypothetical protein
MSSDDFLLTDEELSARDRRRRRLRLIIAGGVLLLISGVFLAKPASHTIKAWQARRHAQKAFALIAREKWPEARSEASAAYQLRATEPQAVRAVARFLSRTRQPDALDFWQQLEKLEKLAPEDLRDEAAIALVTGETAKAEEAIGSLLKSKEAGPAVWLLETQLSIQKGVADDAFTALDKIFADARATGQQQFQAALLERSLAASSPGAADRVNDAWSRLQKLAMGKDAVGLDALVLLAQQLIVLPQDAPHPFALTTEEIRKALEAHPLAQAPHKLLALDLLEHVDVRAGLAGQAGQSNSRRADNVNKAIAQWKDGDAPQLLALATWLNGKGEFQRQLDAIPIDKALKSRELFLQHVDALGALGRWSEIKDLLGNERFPLDQVIQKMYLARASTQLGEEAAADNNWHRALEVARDDAGKLLTLADYAEKNGKVDIAEAAYSTALNQSPKLRPAFQGKLRIAQTNRDTKEMHNILAGMLKIWPNDPSVQNDEAYLRLLLLPSDPSTINSQPSTLNEIAQLAANLVQHNPRSLPHRTLLALAFLKQDRPADALKVYENIQVASSALTPSSLAVHTAVLGANGRIDDAKTEAAPLKPEQILPEEAALISVLLGGP